MRVNELVSVLVAKNVFSQNAVSSCPELRELVKCAGGCIDHRTISANIKALADEYHMKQLEQLKRKTCTLTFDEWTDCFGRVFFVALLIYKGGQYIVNADSMCVKIDSIKTQQVHDFMEEAANTAKSLGIYLSGIVTDNGPAMGAGRRLYKQTINAIAYLASDKKFPIIGSILTLPCVCHQLNRVNADIFAKIMDAMTYDMFHKFAVSLRRYSRNKLIDLGHPIALGNDTRWDTHFVAGLTLLKLYNAYQESPRTFSFLKQSDLDLMAPDKAPMR